MHGIFTLRITASNDQRLLLPMSKTPSSTQRAQGKLDQIDCLAYYMFFKIFLCLKILWTVIFGVYFCPTQTQEERVDS